jgi:hypothetical protein
MASVAGLGLLFCVVTVHAEFVPTPLVEEGDVVEGVGLVTRIDNLAINSTGQWLVEADTDNPNSDADSVLLRLDELFWQEDANLQAPEDARLDSFDSVTISDTGHSGFNFFLDGTSGSGDDSGIYADLLGPGSDPFTSTVLVVQEGSAAPGLPDGTIFIGFFDVKINNGNQLFTVASIDDPTVPSSVDRVLYRLETDAESGGITDFLVIAEEGDVLPGQTEQIDDFETNPQQSAFNDDSTSMFIVDLAGNTGADSAVYIFDEVDFTLIAQEGQPSPVDGRNWGSFTSAAVDLGTGVGGNHPWVIRGRLDGDTATDRIIVRNGEKLVQEGDAVPGIEGDFVFTSFGTGPVFVADTEDVLWYGEWNDPNGDVNSGLFRNQDLLVQEGVTEINGVPVDTIRGITEGFAFSNNGRFVLFEAVLANGVEGAYSIDLGGQCPEDLNNDGVVDVEDLLLLLAAWGQTGVPADIDGDGVVAVGDLLLILAAWGECP